MGSHNTLSVDNPEKMAVTNGYGTGGSVGALNFTYIFMCALFIFLMQIGFAMLEVGMVSTKNTKNIMIKGVVDVMVGALAYFVCGFSFTYGAPDDDPSEFAGGSKYWFGDSLNDEMNWIEWFFQFCFAATAATIVSGAVAERCHLVCYIIYSIALTSFIYPIVAYWQWSGQQRRSLGSRRLRIGPHDWRLRRHRRRYRDWSPQRSLRRSLWKGGQG